tara:strand:+ start:176 stop:2428 length:2253 start_codon:yes stop_codon:yes gene_type:complete
MGLGIRQVLKFAEEASKLEALETAFTTLSGGGTKASEALERLQEATNGTVSSMDLFQQANNAMILGVTKNSDEMAEMFDMAQRLGRALGRDTRSSIESFVTGVGRQSRLMLDNIGLIVKAEVAYKAFAIQVNKDVDELDEMERKQAFLNAALVAGEIALRGIGGETLSSADKLQQMSTQLVEVRQKLGDELLPFVLDATTALKEFAESIEPSDIREVIASLQALGVVFISVKSAMFGAKMGAMALATELTILTGGVFAIIAALGVYVTALMQEAFEAQLEYIAKLKETRRELEDTRKALLDYSDFVANYEKNRANAIALIEAETQIIIDSNEKMFKTFDVWLSRVLKTKTELDKIRKEESERSKVYNDLTKDLTDDQIKRNKNLIDVFVDSHMKRFKANVEREEQEKKLSELEKQFAKIEKARADIKNAKAKAEEQDAIRRYEAEKDRILKEIELVKDQMELDSLLGDFSRFLNRRRADDEQQKSDKIKAILDFEAKFKEQHLRTLEQQDRQYAQSRMSIEMQVRAFLEKLNKKEIEDEINKRNIQEQLWQSQLSAFNGFSAELNNMLNQRVDNELASLKATSRYQEASMEERQTMEENVMREHSQAQLAMFYINKAARLADIAINTATSITSLMAMPGGLGLPLIPFVEAMGAAQAIAVMATPAPPTFETGGLVGGRSHAQGGTLIEAERGEFVMSKRAVQAVGIETMNEINQGAGTGLTINISAPLVDETVVDTIIPAIQKAQRMNLA